MSLTARFKTDTELETKGAKFELPANEDGSIPAFYLARMSNTNPRYLKVLNETMKPFQRELALGVLSEEKANELRVNIFVDSILTGWENVLYSDVFGENDDMETRFATFDKKAATQLLGRLPELHKILETFASNMANFLESNRKEAAKN
jgi:hypothetical protein